MSRQILCEGCGHANPLTTLFCERCGEKLDLSRVTARDFVPGPTTRVFGTLVRLVRWGVLLALVAVLALLLWPVNPTGAAGTREDALSLFNKLVRLEGAVRQGGERVEVITEAEANGYLAEMVKRTGEDGPSGWRALSLEEINLNFDPDHVNVLIVARWQRVPISYEIRGVPSVRENGFRFDVERARLGHLPLPGLAASWAVGQVARVFALLEREQRLMERMGGLMLGEERVRMRAE